MNEKKTLGQIAYEGSNWATASWEAIGCSCQETWVRIANGVADVVRRSYAATIDALRADRNAMLEQRNTALVERDEARAECERLRAEIANRLPVDDEPSVPPEHELPAAVEKIGKEIQPVCDPSLVVNGTWEPTPKIRWRKSVLLGDQLQQLWVATCRAEEWRDVGVV